MLVGVSAGIVGKALEQLLGLALEFPIRIESKVLG